MLRDSGEGCRRHCTSLPPSLSLPACIHHFIPLQSLQPDVQMDLITAAVAGNEATAAALMAAGAAVDTADRFHRTALHYAAKGNHAAIVAPLLAAGAPVDAVDLCHQTVLHYAAWGNHTAAMQQLLDAGASPLTAADDGQLPLHFAAQRGGEPAVRLLHAAKPAAATTAASDGKLPLHTAANSANTAAVQLLLEAAPHTATAQMADGKTSLIFACNLAFLSDIRANVPILGTLDVRLMADCVQTIRTIVPAAPVSDALRRLLVIMYVDALVPVFVGLAVGSPLSRFEWIMFPSKKPCLAAALPAVMKRSEAEAAQLVRLLPCAQRLHLRQAALAAPSGRRAWTCLRP